MKSNLAVELPDSDSDSTTSSAAASGFVAIDNAGCGSLPGRCNGGNPIGGLGGLALMAEQSEGWTVRMNLYDVAYALTLDYLISLSKARRAGHNYSVMDNGMLIRVKSGEEFVVPEVGGCLLYTSPSPRD